MIDPKETQEALRGVVVFAPTPFRRDDLSVDIAGFRNNLDYLAQSGIPWIAVAGFVGENSALTPGEYSQVIHAAKDAVNGKSKIIAGVGGGTYLAREAAQAAETGGADCVMVLPPFGVQPTHAGMVEHFRTIAESVGVGVMLHSMPGLTFTPELIEELAETPNIISYKDESGDLRVFEEIVHRVGDRLAYVNGKAEMMMSFYFLAGARCNATAIGNFDPQLALAACDAALAGNYQKVENLLEPRARAWYRLREKNRTYLISLSKASMDLAGLSGGAVRPPLSEISPEDQGKLRDLMEELDYLKSVRPGTGVA